MTAGIITKKARPFMSQVVVFCSLVVIFFEVAVEDKFGDFKVSIDFKEKLGGACSCKSKDWCSHRIASVMLVNEIIANQVDKHPEEGKAYSRKGMIGRVLQERRTKARKAKYRIRYSDNIFGEHLLVNEKGIKYKITSGISKRKQVIVPVGIIKPINWVPAST